MRRTFTYHSNDELSYPALSLTVVSPISLLQSKVVFRVDTGADLSVVPVFVLHALEPEEFGASAIQDYSGRTTMTLTYLVHLKLGNVLFRDVVVVPSETDSALLGLNVLNQLNVSLKGPRKLLVVH